MSIGAVQNDGQILRLFPNRTVRIGLVSDSHGLVRPAVISALQGVDLILHGGDVGKSNVLAELSTIAPVYAVRGNVDRDDWANALPAARRLQVGRLRIFLLHRQEDVDHYGGPANADLVIFGHSHKPALIQTERRVYANPGSIGPRRFRLPISLMVWTLFSSGHFEANRLDFDV